MDNTKVRKEYRLKNKKSFYIRKRGFLQALATIASNPKVSNFVSGGIYQGDFKSVCVPGLNCYSCPAAAFSCPIGALQTVIGSTGYKFPYYVVGILLFFGVMLGRFVCGFLCPFGWFQDLLHKIPSKKLSTKKFSKIKYSKYIILLIFVVMLPMLVVDDAGNGLLAFCKYICPAGVFEAGIPLSISNPGIRAILGVLFYWKMAIFVAVVFLSIIIYRPFCKYICPLGAIYSLFNRVSIYQYKFRNDLCIGCERCVKSCKMDVDIRKSQSHLECIRCGECEKVCPTNAIVSGIDLISDMDKIGGNYEKSNS